MGKLYNKLLKITGQWPGSLLFSENGYEWMGDKKSEKFTLASSKSKLKCNKITEARNQQKKNGFCGFMYNTA